MKLFIDCVVHCGESILRARKQFGNNIRIVSFEPIPYFSNELSKIWKGYDNIQLRVWEQHIPTIGKAHSMLVERPKTLLDMINYD